VQSRSFPAREVPTFLSHRLSIVAKMMTTRAAKARTPAVPRVVVRRKAQARKVVPDPPVTVRDTDSDSGDETQPVIMEQKTKRARQEQTEGDKAAYRLATEEFVGALASIEAKQTVMMDRLEQMHVANFTAGPARKAMELQQLIQEHPNSELLRLGGGQGGWREEFWGENDQD